LLQRLLQAPPTSHLDRSRLGVDFELVVPVSTTLGTEVLKEEPSAVLGVLVNVGDFLEQEVEVIVLREIERVSHEDEVAYGEG
jgi:hypothetical protein